MDGRERKDVRPGLTVDISPWSSSVEGCGRGSMRRLITACYLTLIRSASRHNNSPADPFRNERLSRGREDNIIVGMILARGHFFEVFGIGVQLP